jgi:hypothetical protein
LVDGGIDYFKGDADVNVSVVAQNFSMVKMAGRSFGRKKNYGLTVTVSSKPWMLLFVNLYLSVVRQKKNCDFWDLNQGPKSRLQSSRHYTTIPPPFFRRHKYYIPTYLQARCVSCRVSLAATHTAMPPVIFAPTN